MASAGPETSSPSTPIARPCVDCLKEVRMGIRPFSNNRQSTSSYCGHHVYQRGKDSRHRKALAAVIEMLQSEQSRTNGIGRLRRTNKYGLPSIEDRFTIEFAKEWEEAAGELRSRIKDQISDPSQITIGERRKKFRPVYEKLYVAFCLRNRRLPTPQEDVDMRFKESDPYHEYDEELERQRSRPTQRTISVPDEDMEAKLAKWSGGGADDA
jgi:hypothetical protein